MAAAEAGGSLERRDPSSAARGVRAFGDGFVALLLPIYLLDLGFSAFARSRALKALVQPSSHGSEQ